MLQTRKEFKLWFNHNYPAFSTEPDSVLWIPERSVDMPCQWFVTVKPIGDFELPTTYWTWCRQNLKGHVACFFSNGVEQKECWGFTDKRDIEWWVLKWSK